MYNYLWHFQDAHNILRKKGFTYLVRKGVRYLYLSFFRNASDQWWNSYKGLDDAQQKILNFAEARSRDVTDAGAAFLQQAFSENMQIDQGLSKEYIDIFLNSVVRRNFFRDFHDDAQELLFQQTKKLDYLSLPFDRWFALQYLCYRNGLFKTAFIVRQKAVDKVYADAENYRISTVDRAFRAAIDQAEFKKAYIFLDHMRKRKSPLFKERDSYYNLNTGNLREFQQTIEMDFNKLDNKFLRYVEGKSVAIVGPAPSGEENGNEIDSFDIILRINYNGRDKLPDSKEFGKRTDIAYYSTIFATEIHEFKKRNNIHEIDFAIFKKIEYDFQKQLFESQKGLMLKRNGNLFNGKPHAGNHALFHILHFRPASVKLFNINFYLSTNPYYSGYFDTSLPFFDKFLSFSHHDLMSNINFTRNLWTAGIIEVDNICRDVLGLTTFEYISAMEKMLRLGSFTQE